MHFGHLPLFASPRYPWLFIGNALENVKVYGFVFLEDHRGNVKVALKTLNFVAELLGQVGHVLPFLHLVEELNHTEREAIVCKRKNT